MRRLHTCSVVAVVFLMLWLSGCTNSGPSGETATTVPVSTSPAAPTSAPATAPAPTSPAGPTSAAHHTAEPAATAPPAALNPNCAFEPIDIDKYGGEKFKIPHTVSSQNGVLRTDLDVRYAKHTIAGCPVELRSYNGKLVGDTLRVKPGDTIEITLTNNLPKPGDAPWSNPIYNVTNLHTHGLHVSPTGSATEGWGDNVLLRIWPKGTPPPAGSGHGDEGMIDIIGEAHYKIKIPANHPPGTFWYHAHAHGSTAAQASSGMGGALIVEGGLDDVPKIKAATDQVFVFQQNVYSATGTIEMPNYADFGPCSWEGTHREHMINGQFYPTITMARGEVQRWRFIHAGVRETLSLELRGPDIVTATSKLFLPITLPTNDLNEIAVDGIALGRIDTWQQVTLNPGYRSDVLVQIDKPGTYYLIDGLSSDNALTCSGDIEQPSALAKVIVTDDANPMQLPSSASLASLAPFEDLVSMDLTQAPGSEQFLVPKGPIATFQDVDFTVAVHPVLSTTSTLTAPLAFLASDHSFDAGNARKLTLNNTDLWILTTKPDALYFAHPFHIHINPFQTWRTDPHGNPELVWRDTLLVPQGPPQYIYTKYTDFTGAFVYHCHILDHEDQGMMEKVEIIK
ncbi:MAG: multicopper oxidase family protein [Roseiflexaceae bacterium]